MDLPHRRHTIPRGRRRVVASCRVHGLFSLVVAMGFALPSLAVELRGRIDAEFGGARVYLQDENGKYFFVESLDATSKTIRYDVKRGPRSFEQHTTVDGGFKVDLSPGMYELTVEKGKEFLPFRKTVVLKETPAVVDVKLERWIDMNARGWFSGDTHVHRKVEDLKTLSPAEDLNVALPLTSWVTDSRETPATHNKNPDPVPAAKLIEIDKTHVIWPVNTEYEIFTVDGRGHTLGAVFVLNHKKALTMPAPPVRPIAEAARRQGALLDLDKHNWPWSMMIVPEMEVGLFELTNNHLWRTEFLFGDWYKEYGRSLIGGEGPLNEREWIDFGFANYYALLNCGFGLKPSAGTASGVHPVPLGYGRVYVNIDGDFSYEKWVDGLAKGRSFVTTGPMLECTIDGKFSDERLERQAGDRVVLRGKLASLWRPADASTTGSIEVIVNGKKLHRVVPQPIHDPGKGYRLDFDMKIDVRESCWIAVRAWTQGPNDRLRFAHTAPFHVDVAEKPLLPKEAEVRYLIDRVEDEIARHRGVLSKDALAEYESALATYRKLFEAAR